MFHRINKNIFSQKQKDWNYKDWTIHNDERKICSRYN